MENRDYNGRECRSPLLNGHSEMKPMIPRSEDAAVVHNRPLAMSLWIHISSLVTLLLFFWTDIVDSLGKVRYCYFYKNERVFLRFAFHSYYSVHYTPSIL